MRDGVRFVVATAPQPGAIAIIDLHGPGVREMLLQLTGRDGWPLARLRLCDFAGIDEGLAVLLREDWAQLMPHGGPRVVERLVEKLVELGATPGDTDDAISLYPEAATPIEADVLHAIARAASPAAIDLLAAQTHLWRSLHDGTSPRPQKGDLLRDSDVLDRLITPPTVVVAGRPNVGKSTLTNAMLGRAVSIVADLPGTTRDWVAGLAELGPPQQAVAVRWLDTPGVRDSADRVERQAIAMAREVIASADVLVAMRDPGIDWPDEAALPRRPDLWVINKMDKPGAQTGSGTSPERALPISAANDRGLDRLAHLILRRLGLAELGELRPWAFSPTLRAWARGEAVDLNRYIGGATSSGGIA